MMDPVAAYLQYGEGRRGVVFAPNVEFAADITRRLQEAGVPSELITGATPNAVRAGLRDRVTSGDDKTSNVVQILVYG